MKTYKNDSKGFSLIELLVVIVILGVLTSTATPIFIRAVRNAQSTQCLSTRHQVEEAVSLFRGEHPDAPMPTISQLLSAGYLNGWPRCSAGGEYVWISEDILNPKLGCSIHYWEEEEIEEEIEEEKEEPKKDKEKDKKDKEKDKKENTKTKTKKGKK